MKRWLLMALMLIAACGSTLIKVPSLGLAIYPVNLTLTEKELLSAAVMVWNQSLHREIIYFAKDCCVPISAVSAYLDPYRIGETRRGLFTTVSFKRTGDLIETWKTLTHELGHALGLRHNPDPNSVMYFQTGNAWKPTEEDLEMVRKLWL